MHPLLTFLVTGFINKYGLYISQLTGGILLILGAGCRLLIN